MLAKMECPIREDGICMNADEIAEKAVKKVFAILGVDIDKPDAIEEFRLGLRFSQRLRRASDRGSMAIWILFCVSVAAIVGHAVLKAFGLEFK